MFFFFMSGKVNCSKRYTNAMIFECFNWSLVFSIHLISDPFYYVIKVWMKILWFLYLILLSTAYVNYLLRSSKIFVYVAFTLSLSQLTDRLISYQHSFELSRYLITWKYSTLWFQFAFKKHMIGQVQRW